MIRDMRRQAPAARMIGEFAVKHGSRVASERLGSILSVVTAVRHRPASSESASSEAVSSKCMPTDVSVGTDAELARGSSGNTGASVPSSAEPFPNYDSYTARQVLDRIASASELERIRVRDYESAHRARETILSALSALTPPGVAGESQVDVTDVTDAASAR